MAAVLRPGEAVFASICSSLLSSATVYALLRKLGLTPFVYQGLTVLPPGQISNVHWEARSDLQNCRAVFAAVDLDRLPKDWTVARASEEISRGVPVFAYIFTETEIESQHAGIPDGVYVRWVRDVREFEASLLGDALSLLHSQSGLS